MTQGRIVVVFDTSAVVVAMFLNWYSVSKYTFNLFPSVSYLRACWEPLPDDDHTNNWLLE